MTNDLWSIIFSMKIEAKDIATHQTIKVFKVLVKEVDRNEKFLHFCSPKTTNLAVMDKVNS